MLPPPEIYKVSTPSPEVYKVEEVDEDDDDVVFIESKTVPGTLQTPILEVKEEGSYPITTGDIPCALGPTPPPGSKYL
jgi:hypothetical protein